MSSVAPYLKNRQTGIALVNGLRYDRQHAIVKNMIIGKAVDVVFTLTLAEVGIYAIIEADLLQPSHLGSAVNHYHFIPEAQPRNRALSQSGALTPERIARNLRPEEILIGSTAYVGAPVVNDRGEVIQGNGRAYALKTYYKQFPADPNGYRKAILTNQQLFGMAKLAEKLKPFKRPVLVRMLDVTDKEAIRIGQFTQADTEAVTRSGQKSKSKARLLTKPVLKKITGELMRVDSDDKTLTELIRDSRVLSVLVREGILNSGDLELYTKNDTINEAGVQFVSELLLNALFAGSDLNVSEVFSQSPQPVQNIVKKSTLYLLRLPAGKGLGKEVGNAVVAFRDYQSSGAASFSNWLNQYDLSGLTPRNLYSDVELKIAALFANITTQREVINKFKRYSVLVNDQTASVFESASPGKRKSVAINVAFDARYQPDEGHKQVLRRVATALKAKAAHRYVPRAKSPTKMTPHVSTDKAKAQAKAKAKLKLLSLQF